MRKLISLDVFDTAIFRKVFYPTDIFNLVENEVGHDFKNERIKAQRTASRTNVHCNIIDIYKQFPFKFNPKVEIQAEYKNCKANPYILEMYNKENVDFIFISDMYLPANVIKSMLEKCGYKDPKVFVSCDLQAFKGDGRLFAKVQEVLNRKIDKHIGDNYNADILGAKKAGIPEVEYIGPPVYQRQVVTPALENVKLRKLLIDKELSNASIEEKIGYQFAPVVLSFTKKILDEAKDNQTIFFNARDGFLMYIVARWILKTKKKIKYCRFSRKSCFLADIVTNFALTHRSNTGVFTFFKIQRLKCLRDFLRTYGLNENRNFSRIFGKYNINLDSEIEFHPRKQSIISDTLILVQDELYQIAKEARKNFVKYVSNIGMKNGDIFVDLGYVGTLQGVIKRITGIDLKGSYILTLGSLIGNYNGVMYKKSSFFQPNIIRGGAVVEYVFTEPKGTVVDYNNEGEPVLLKDLKVRKEISKKILIGVLKGCQELYDENIMASVEDCTKVLKRYVDNPTIEEATFGNQPLFENGSDSESITWFDEKWIKRGEIRGCYGRSYWKSAFRVLLKNHPLYKFLEKELPQY